MHVLKLVRKQSSGATSNSEDDDMEVKDDDSSIDNPDEQNSSQDEWEKKNVSNFINKIKVSFNWNNQLT